MANALTLSRLFLAPFFIFFFLLGLRPDADPAMLWTGKIGALVIAAAFELTDMFDGMVARARGEVSDFGKLVDPLADNVSRFTVFLSFLAGGYVGIWPVALIFYREMIVAALRNLAAKEGVAMAARASGKIKAIVQGVVILVICVADVVELASPRGLNVPRLAEILMWVVVAVTLWSLVDYVSACRGLLRKLLKGA